MAKVIVYQRPDGGVSVVYPAPGFTVEDILTKDVPADAKNAQIIEDTQLPDKAKRNYWKLDSGKVSVDTAKEAKEKADKDKMANEKKNALAKLGLTAEELKMLLMP